MPRIISGHFSFIIFRVVIDFSKIPFIRLLIPFVSGVILYLNGAWSFNPTLYLIIAFVLLALIFTYSKISRNGAGKTYFLVVSDLFLFIAACYACYFVQPKNNPAYYGYYNTSKETNWAGTLDEIINEKENFLKAIVVVNSVNNQKTTGKIVAYFKKPF
ncbi:MAG TPA: hypothetical protein PLC65_03190, partial [Bacteroidia bacterium]|nr:hypothetical protein [Bacteroidia bacterium]